MAKKILTSLDLRGDILIGGTANTTSGYVLTSNGAGAISWSAASGGSGNAFTAIYTTNGPINNSFPSSSTAISVFGGNTTPTLGYTVAVDNTYEFEFSGRLSIASTTSAQTPTFSIGSTTVTLSPSVGVVGQINYSTNTSAITSQAAVNSAYFTSTAALTQAATGTSRFYTIFAKGIIRVTGTGTVKIYPALSATVNVDNVWTWGTGTTFKLTALGNGSVTTVGTWA